MTQQAKSKIKQVFLEQINEKPLNKITVKTIVEECQINRNTFYYHYGDIYDLIREIFNEQIRKAIRVFIEKSSWEESVLSASTFVAENKKAMKNLFDSVDKELVIKYVYENVGNVMLRYVRNINKNIGASDEHVKIITFFYQSAITQFIYTWLKNDLEVEMEEGINNISIIFKGSIEDFLRKAVNIKKSSS